ncbi:mitochondrial 2-enoyl thioester reductase [Mycoemilia scoparia]|uniref:enoyl-[acyl-carrier-protein] reductase n=1 Tax=Mycoemilia scoparia TaxID=417184 RepID=A0A9W8A5Y9_9FUNG|nr:mitochondrial 2-enoyl thioester reductase [Mycoemilia scoparia]
MSSPLHKTLQPLFLGRQSYPLHSTLQKTNIYFGSKHKLFHQCAYNLSAIRKSRAAVYEKPGPPNEVLKIADISLSDDIPEGMALIRMMASPVNPSDLNQIEGLYPVKGQFSNRELVYIEEGADSQTPKNVSVAIGGNEGVGEILKVGETTEDSKNFEVGAWVLPNQSGKIGTWCTHAIVPTNDLVAVPNCNGVTPEQVSTIKVNPSTAYRMLKDFVDLSPGDYVIQNGANSGVGRAVIQLCREWGINTINIIRDRDNFDELSEELKSLGATMVIKDTDLKSSDVSVTLNNLEQPIKLGLNCVGGKQTLAMTKFLSRHGILVTYGGMSRQPVTLPTSFLIFKDIQAKGFWMTRWYKSHSEQERLEMWDHLLSLMRQGKLVSQPMTQINWSENGTPSELAEKLALGTGWGSKHMFVF